MNKNNNFTAYRKYLNSITFKAKIYRKFFYFPILNNCLEPPILEIGCGIGGFLEYRKNKDIIGLDINPELVEICKAKGLKAEVMDYDILPFDEYNFNSILLDNVLEHIESPHKIFNEISRVLKKNGKLLISVPGKKGFEHDTDHKKFYDSFDLDEKLKSHNFSNVKKFYTPFKSEWLNENMRQYCLHGLYKKND